MLNFQKLIKSKWVVAVVAAALVLSVAGVGAAFAQIQAKAAPKTIAKLSLIENHILVTKDGTENIDGLDNFINQVSNFVELEYQSDGTAIATGVPTCDMVASKIMVKLAGVGDGETTDITDECTILDKRLAKVQIPKKYITNVEQGTDMPTLYVIYNGSEGTPHSYKGVYVSVNIDGEEIHLPSSIHADPGYVDHNRDQTIDGYTNFRFWGASQEPLANGTPDSALFNIPFNVASIFGDGKGTPPYDDSFLNYDIQSVEVWTGSNMDVIENCTFTKLDNTDDKYFQVDKTANTIIGLDSVFTPRLAIRVTATTKDVVKNIVQPQLFGSVGTDTITVKKVDGYEYSCDGGNTWQESNTFTGLAAGTTYNIVQRPLNTSTVSATLKLTTAQNTEQESNPEWSPVVWNPPFNVGDKFYGNDAYIRFTDWPSDSASTFEVKFTVSGGSEGWSTYVNTMGSCASPGFMCKSETENGLDVVAECVALDKTTGVATFNYFINGQAKSMQNVVGNFTVTISIPGAIELTKKSSNESISNANACYSLEGAKYGVYNDGWDCNNQIGELVTNGDGYARLDNLNAGTYWVRETEPSHGYAKDEQVYQVNVGAGTTTAVNGGVVFEVPQNDPVGILLGKRDLNKHEGGFSSADLPEGSAKLNGAQFEVTYYDVEGTTNQDGVSKSVVDAIVAKAKTSRTWVFETDEDGYCDYNESYKSSGDALYTNLNGQYSIPLGTITIREVSAPTGYLNNNEGKYWVRTVTSAGNTETVETYDAPNGETAIKEQVKKGDVSITKQDLDSLSTTPQGQADLSGIKFMIKNVSENSVVVDGIEYASGADIENSVITTDKDGNACTTGKRLPYGDYEIREIEWNTDNPDYANASYMFTDKTVKKFVVREDGEVVTKDTSGIDMIFNDMVVRGGVSVEKRDIETKASCALGGATLAGTKFQIKLKEGLNQNPVYVNGKWYREGEIIDLLAGDASYNTEGAHDLYPNAAVKATLITDEDGKVKTPSDSLPYATYTIQEVAASTGYLLTDGKERTFEVRVDGYIKPYKQQGENGKDDAWYNQVKRANISFSKKMEGTSNRGKWIPFLLTSKSTGETHVVVTDENGYFDTDKYPHSTNTNTMDALVQETSISDASVLEVNGKQYTYNSEWLREATDDDAFSFELNGKKMTLDEKKLQNAAAEYGVWFGMDVDGNIAPVNDDLCAMPYDTELFQNGGYTLQELPCSNNYGFKLVTVDVNVRQDKQKIDYGTVDDEQKPSIYISKTDATTGEEVEGASLLLEKVNEQGEWEEVDEWVSTSEVHVVKEQSVGKYRLTETLVPKTYEQAKAIEFEIREGEILKQVEMKDVPIEISGKIDKRQNALYEIDTDGSYVYTVDYRNTSNVWADEMNMLDTIDCAVENKAHLQYVNTPVMFGDYDGKMNVWYKTNKTDDTDATDSEKYNACLTNPENPHNPDNERVHDFTGWKLWKQDVSTLKSETLFVKDLGLADDEYVTGVAFENGRVEVGAGSAKVDSKQWVRDELKNESDFVVNENDAYMISNVGDDEIVTVKHNDTFLDSDENEVSYQPAVFGMKATDETLEAGGVELWNSANMDIHRNLAPNVPKLNDDDEDKVVQTTPKIGTTATDKEDGDKVLAIADEITITDEVSYENLVVGKEYEMIGNIHLVNEDGTDGGTVEGSESVVKFIPTEKNGTVSVDMIVNTTDLEGKSLVAFEKCRLDETVVATHEDIYDEGQTVTVDKPVTEDEATTSTSMPKTGDIMLFAAAMLFIIATGSITVAHLGKKHRNKGSKNTD